MVPFAKQLVGFLAVGAMAFLGCNSTATTPTDRVSLTLHQSARLSADISVRADSIQDSRCPVNANCIWAGQAKVKLLLSKGTDSSTVRLVLDAAPRNDQNKRLDSMGISLNNQLYKVILREVNPYSGTGTPGQPQTVLVQVTKL